MHVALLFPLAIRTPTGRWRPDCSLVGCVTVQLLTLTLPRYSATMSISTQLLGCVSGPPHVSHVTPITWPIHVANPLASLVELARGTGFATFSMRVPPGWPLAVSQ